MLQGTSSNVGKSVLATALCRIFFQDGNRVVPFKAQNMALNSYVTKDGGEMGRAQVAQAEAAGLEPSVDMNPVLLKPTGNASSQVILLGQPVGNMSAKEYHKGYSLRAFDTVKTSLHKLQQNFDTIVIEGAGSPAEVNLKANDIVNMRVAEYLQAPVLLIADIDRGGALASLVGTLALLTDTERALVKGLVINKFRGDIELLRPALSFLEEKTGKPVLGVLPYLDNLGIDEEDSVALGEYHNKMSGDIRIAVIRLPQISNFTDFSSLAAEADVALRYAATKEDLQAVDLIIIPGSKNTIADMAFLQATGMAALLQAKVREGIPLIGICGGYQILGKSISDPEQLESDCSQITGLGLLPMTTIFASGKKLAQIEVACHDLFFAGDEIDVVKLDGYEIHMGESFFYDKVYTPLHVINDKNKNIGAISTDGLVFGTYIHGLFDNDSFRRKLLNNLRRKKNLPDLSQIRCQANEKQKAYDRLADVVRSNLDMALLHKIMYGSRLC